MKIYAQANIFCTNIALIVRNSFVTIDATTANKILDCFERMAMIV